jgi:hypothetical protein
MVAENETVGVAMTGFFWWTKQLLLALTCCFFIFFGIYLLVAAYHLEDPFSFVMTFFASNLIILISAALLVGFVLQMVAHRKKCGTSENGGPGS